MELAGSVAPNANVELVIAGNTATSDGLFLAAEHAVYGNIAPILSLSFGGCEAAQTPSGEAAINSLWQQAAAQGQTVLVSSGDAGSATCDNDNTQYYAVNGQAVNGLASTPYNVAVGGTDFYYAGGQSDLATYWNTTATNTTPTESLKQLIPEQPWNDSQYGLNLLAQASGTTSIAAGGGGASSCATGSGSSCAGFPKPAWQKATGVPADGVRDVPDVSLFAANGANRSFYPICVEDGDCQPVSSGEIQISGVGGTSASTPAFAGMMALVNQLYGPQGQANFTLYPLSTQFPAAFHDVKNGTNSVPCATGTPDCIAVSNPETITDPNLGTAVEGQIGNTTAKTAEWNATSGYDLATGLGTIDANVMVSNWNKVTFTPTTTTLAPSQTSFAHGTSIIVSGAVTPNASTGTVALLTDSPEPLNPANGLSIFNLAGGAYTGNVNYLPGGTYNVYGSYSGDGTHAPSTSAKTQITVTPEASKVTLTGTDQKGNSTVSGGASITYGTQLLLTATPGPTTGTATSVPTGTVSFTDGSSSLDTAKLDTSGAAVFNAAPLVGSHSIVAAYSGDASYAANSSSALAFSVVKDTPEFGYFYSGTDTSNTTVDAIAGATTITLTLINNANGNASSGTYQYVPVVPPTGVVTMTGLPSGTLTFPALASTLDPNYGFVEGTASVAVPAGTAAGNYTITLSYPGDANYNSNSVSGTITISKSIGLASTTTATATPASTSTTSPVTVTTTVTGQSGKSAPTGTVTFFVAGYYIGPVTLPAGTGDSTTVSVQVNSAGLLTGVNAATTQYSGDATYAPSFGTFTINNGANANFSLAGSDAIAVTAGGTGTATIAVTPIGGFKGTVALSCAVTPVTTSTPTCSVAAPAAISGVSPVSAVLTLNSTGSTTPGTYVATVTGTSGSLIQTTSVPVTIKVSTKPSFALSNGGPITVTVGGSGSSTITVTPSGGFTGAVALTCAVTPTTGASVPLCSVTPPVTISGTTAGTSTLTVTTTAATTTGAYTVTVSGTAAGVTTATTAVALTVNPVPLPAIALGNSGAITIPSAGGSGTSTITVTPSNGFKGSVALACVVTPTTGTSVPTCTVTTPVTISGTAAGMATRTVTATGTTTAGAYTVTVTGTATAVASASTAVAVTVSAPTPTIALTNSGLNPTTLAPGSSGTSAITVTSGGGFAGSVALTCAVTPADANPSDTPTCLVTSPVNVTGTTPGTATLTVGTKAAAAMEMPKLRLLSIGGGVAAAALLFFLVPVRRRRLTTLLGAIVLMAMVGLSAGCGSGSSSTKDPGTTVEPYMVTVTGTATGVASATTTVQVTVQ